MTEEIIEIKEEVQVGDYMLEAGDKIKILTETQNTSIQEEKVEDNLIVKYDYDQIRFLSEYDHELFYQIKFNKEIPSTSQTGNKFELLAKSFGSKQVEFYDGIVDETYPATLLFMEGGGDNGKIVVSYSTQGVEKTKSFDLMMVEAYTR